jgi:hypothetical protein
MNARRQGIAALALIGTAFGCLPAGNPPPGHHVVHDRTLSCVYLSPSEIDGVPSYLFATGPSRRPPLDGPLSSVTLADLYGFPGPNTPATTDGLAGMQPVVEGIEIPSVRLTAYTLTTDILGRLLFVQFDPLVPPSQENPFKVMRFDPNSGAGAFVTYVDLLSETQPFILSPGRSRGFARSLGSGKVFELEGEHSLGSVGDAAFLGEDFYCAGNLPSTDPNFSPTGSNIIRIRPNAEPEVLLSSTGGLGFAPILGDRAPQLLLSLSTDIGYSPFALLDTETLVSTSLPSPKGQASFVSASSNGHWLLFDSSIPSTDSTQPSQSRFFLFDWTAGAYTTLDSEQVGQPIGGYNEWRPGRDELWFSTLPDGLAVWSPGANIARIHTERSFQAPDDWTSAFTRDGQHWFSTDGGKPALIFVGSADDPGAPVLRLNPSGTKASLRETTDGQLLVQAWSVDSYRSDIYLIDSDTGTSRVIGGDGHQVVLGQTRTLALLNFDLARLTGDLTLVDLASGAHTFLAPDVYAVAVDRGKSASISPGTDVLAPGTRVAFLTRNRLDSPYDGLWVSTLP